MGLRAKVSRLEKAARGKLDYIELADGTRHYYDPEAAFWELFLYFTDSMRAVYHEIPRPEPPKVLRAVANAKDRGEALSRVMNGSSFLPIEKEALVECGEFVPRSLVAGRAVDEPVGDLSEP